MVSLRKARLALWMNGQHVGWWNNAAEERQTLEYSSAWLRSPFARPISLSLPLTPEGAQLQGPRVRAWFDNLLPDSTAIRERIAMRFGLTSTSPFELLREIGRDCVGALQLLGDDEQPSALEAIHGEVLDDEAIERLLIRVVRPSALGRQDADAEFRISIAGAQEKTALLRHEGRWLTPLGSTPTTHILKLPLGRVGNLGIDLRASVENEWLCLRLMAAFGLRVPQAEIAVFGSQKALVVERFDRRLHPDATWYLRLPQEDFCQVTGTPALAKYEAEGGPGMREILGVLAGSADRDRDRADFFRSQMVFRLLAAPDGHAKNFSVFIESAGAFRMTPFYDVLSAWPLCGDGPGLLPWRRLKLAMAVRTRNAHYHMHEVRRRHWEEVGRRLGLGPGVGGWIDDIADRVPGAIDEVRRQLPVDFPSEIFDKVSAGMKNSVDSLRH